MVMGDAVLVSRGIRWLSSPSTASAAGSFGGAAPRRLPGHPDRSSATVLSISSGRRHRHRRGRLQSGLRRHPACLACRSENHRRPGLSTPTTSLVPPPTGPSMFWTGTAGPRRNSDAAESGSAPLMAGGYMLFNGPQSLQRVNLTSLTISPYATSAGLGENDGCPDLMDSHRLFKEPTKRAWCGMKPRPQ